MVSALSYDVGEAGAYLKLELTVCVLCTTSFFALKHCGLGQSWKLPSLLNVQLNSGIVQHWKAVLWVPLQNDKNRKDLFFFVSGIWKFTTWTTVLKHKSRHCTVRGWIHSAIMWFSNKNLNKTTTTNYWLW